MGAEDRASHNLRSQNAIKSEEDWAEERTVDSVKAEDKSAFLGPTSVLNFVGGEALAQTTQRSSGCPVRGNIQGQFG